MASFFITDCTEHSVTIHVAEIESGQTIRFYVREDPDPGYAEADETYTAYSSNVTQTFYGLSPETDYACNVNIDGVWLGTQYFTTERSVSVDVWSWYASNGNASTAQTKAAYDAITNNGHTNEFSYLVWNDMVDKVYEILDATGDSWNTRYASYSETKMSISDKTITAQRFNSLRCNIELHCHTGIREVSPGDTVYGWYFITLASCINQCIDSL